MSEALLVCIILAVIYLLECVAWGPAEALPFQARPRGVWTEATELLAVLGNRWRACLAGVVPGAGGIAWAEAHVIAAAPTGVCACGSMDHRGTPIAYEQLGPVRAEGRTLRGGPLALGRVATAAYSRELAARMGEWAHLGPEARGPRIEAELARMLDLRRARRTLRRYRWCVRGLLWPERALAAALFVLLPAALLGRGFAAAWPEAALTLALTVCVTVLFAQRTRRMSDVRRAEGGAVAPISDRVMTMLLAPPAAVRADDAVACETFGGLHAVAVARVAASEALGREIAARSLRELRFPLEGERRTCCEAAAWSRAAWTRALEAWAMGEFGSVEALLAPPVREAGAMRTYCRRCLSQYSRAAGECNACPGVALVGFGG